MFSKPPARALPILLGLSALALASPTQAAPNNGIAVLDFQGTGVPENLLPTLTEVLTAEVDAIGLYQVIAGSDIKTMLGFEEQKLTMGCSDTACLAEIGGALGVDRILSAHIGKVGSTYVVNVKLINIREATTEGRAYKTVKGEVDAVINAVVESVSELLGPGSKTAELFGGAKSSTANASKPAAQPTGPAGLALKEKPPAQEASGPGLQLTALSLGLLGGGVVLGGTGAYFGIQAKANEACANEISTAGTSTCAGAQVAADKAPTQALMANIFYVAGIAALAGGAYFIFSGADEEAPKKTLSLIPIAGPDGVGVSLQGSL